MGCMDLSGFLRAGSLRVGQGRKAMGKRDSIRGVEGSFQKELITLLVTSHYLRAVLLLIN